MLLNVFIPIVVLRQNIRKLEAADYSLDKNLSTEHKATESQH